MIWYLGYHPSDLCPLPSALCLSWSKPISNQNKRRPNRWVRVFQISNHLQLSFLKCLGFGDIWLFQLGVKFFYQRHCRFIIDIPQASKSTPNTCANGYTINSQSCPVVTCCCLTGTQC